MTWLFARRSPFVRRQQARHLLVISPTTGGSPCEAPRPDSIQLRYRRDERQHGFARDCPIEVISVRPSVSEFQSSRANGRLAASPFRAQKRTWHYISHLSAVKYDVRGVPLQKSQ